MAMVDAALVCFPGARPGVSAAGVEASGTLLTLRKHPARTENLGQFGGAKQEPKEARLTPEDTTEKRRPDDDEPARLGRSVNICMANALTRASEDRDNLTKELAGDE